MGDNGDKGDKVAAPTRGEEPATVVLPLPPRPPLRPEEEREESDDDDELLVDDMLALWYY